MKKNKISDVLETQNMSIYALCKGMNKKRPKNAKGINYKTVHTIVNSDSIPYGTHYGNIALIAEVLGVPIDSLEE